MITLSYGGGKQTVAIIVLILEGRLPKPDLIVFADTGREVATTNEYLKKFVQPAIKSIGLQVQVVGHNYVNCDLVKDKSQTILLPAFTLKKGRIGKLPTYCSNEWKQRPIRRWLKEHGINDTDIWIGISLDEVERMKPSGLKWYRHVYPLIELVPMHRNQCVNIIAQHGWPIPNKSRCYMCPNQGARAFRQLKELSNGDFEKAVTLEKQIRLIDPSLYLHPAAIDLEKAVENSELQYEMFDGCDSGYCIT